MVGGVWVLDHEGKRVRVACACARRADGVQPWARAYDCLTTNSSRALSSFSDFAMPPGSPFPTGAEMRRYYAAYCQHFALYPHVHFGARVTAVTERADGRWAVDVAGAEPAVFDRVVCATGTFGVPNMAISWLDSFGGIVMHSALYRSPDAFDRDVHVVVLGIGNSALDISLDLAVSGRFRSITGECRAARC